MKILGIDPGSLKMGYALVELEGRKISYLDSGVVIYPKSADFISKLGLIYSSCLELVERLGPDQISIESLVFVKNISSLSKLSQARGAMLAAFCSTHESKIFEYSPTLVKSTVSGHGHSNKLSIEKSLHLIFGKIDFKSDDQSDALAIAFTHALLGKNKDNNIKSKVLKKTSRRKSNSLKDVFKDRI